MLLQLLLLRVVDCWCRRNSGYNRGKQENWFSSGKACNLHSEGPVFEFRWDAGIYVFLVAFLVHSDECERSILSKDMSASLLNLLNVIQSFEFLEP
jgi:hypothetical protein